jgi:hypothetical protein
MLGAAVQRKRPPAFAPSELRRGDLALQVTLVAGARNPLNLAFSWTAA